MFGFGKTKLSSQEFCNDQWIKITSPERKSIWRAFVEQVNDAALENADFDKLCDVMIAAYLQFLRSTVIKTQGMHSDSVMDFYICISGKKDELNPSIEDYSSIFNKTWGSISSGDKMMDMVSAFEICMDVSLQQSTRKQLSMEFFTLISSMEDVLSKIKLV